LFWFSHPKVVTHAQTLPSQSLWSFTVLGSYTLFTTILSHTPNLLVSLTKSKHVSRPCNFQLKHKTPTLEFRTSTWHDTLSCLTHATRWYHKVPRNILIHFIIRKRNTKILTLSPDMYFSIPTKSTPCYLVASRAISN
jgi:hypothetical protein